MSIALEFRKRLAAYKRALQNRPESRFSEAFSEFGCNYKCYRGHANDKLEIMSAYKYALVIENDKFSCTEKIFDALQAQCIVFYHGPKLKEFIDMRLPHIPLPADIDEATRIIENTIKDGDASKCIEMKNFIFERNEIQKFTEESVARDLVNHIVNYLKSLNSNKE